LENHGSGDGQEEERENCHSCTDIPAPAMSPVITPAPLIEGRRAGKFSSELEFERILRESEMAARRSGEARS
jgi:hypothetical protein